MGEIFVIYDGECDFCKESLSWLEQKVELHSKAFQEIAFTEDQWIKQAITLQQCKSEVVLLASGSKFGGADAIAFLLKARGNHCSSWMIQKSGRFGRSSYRWVAENRNSRIIVLVTKYLRYSNKRFY